MGKGYFEALEQRLNMSMDMNLEIMATSMASPGGYNPQQVVHAYGLDNLYQNGTKLDGTGQTIAIIDAFDAPTIVNDLQTFDQTFGLPAADLTVVKQVSNGQTIKPDTGWSMETSLDVEWAHAIAPGAKILLVETPDASNGLYSAANWAAAQPNVSVISMSWGQIDNPYETYSDGIFTTPTGHQGVTFLAASGDRGNSGYPSNYPTGMYPALSPNVVGVGSTNLTTGANYQYVSETGANFSGGGPSNYEPEPSYQVSAGISSNNFRVNPDVSMLGVNLPIVDSYAWGTQGWGIVNGTSASTPMFGGVMAIADQGRVLNGSGTLDGPTQTLPFFYQHPQAFHDIVQGSTPAYSSGPGYDYVTGLGTPIGNILIPELVGVVPPLSGTGNFTINTVETSGFSNQTIATFTDPNGVLSLDHYKAVVSWGDGTTSNGIITLNNNVFTVQGSHIYNEEGNDNVTITISRDTSSTIVVTDIVKVADAILTGQSAVISPGTTVNGVVASFKDPDTTDTIVDYSATIAWGDGNTSAGVIVVGAYPGQFNVTGNHSYSDKNPHTITVIINHGLNNPITVQSSEPGQVALFKLVDDTYVIGSGTVVVTAANGVLANDTSPGNMTVTAGTVVGSNGGTFVFQTDGSFTYTPSNDFPGFDYVDYKVTDSQGHHGTATVNVLSQYGGIVWKFYESILGRIPDYSGLQFWINDFNNGGKVGDIAVGFFESDELLNKIIGNYYDQYLGRKPDAAGLDYWIQDWHATGGPEEIKANFAASDEFNKEAGNTIDGWLTALYQKILQRSPDQQGYDYWKQQLEKGESEYKVALQFFDSYEEYQNDVTGWFNAYLGRNPSVLEQTGYAVEMELGASDRDIEEQITNSSEYKNNPPIPPAGTANRLPDYAVQDAIFNSFGRF